MPQNEHYSNILTTSPSSDWLAGGWLVDWLAAQAGQAVQGAFCFSEGPQEPRGAIGSPRKRSGALGSPRESPSEPVRTRETP
jgi:hypothetical protein